jgi:hypothetical protein
MVLRVCVGTLSPLKLSPTSRGCKLVSPRVEVTLARTRRCEEKATIFIYTSHPPHSRAQWTVAVLQRQREQEGSSRDLEFDSGGEVTTYEMGPDHI